MKTTFDDPARDPFYAEIPFSEVPGKWIDVWLSRKRDIESTFKTKVRLVRVLQDLEDDERMVFQFVKGSDPHHIRDFGIRKLSVEIMYLNRGLEKRLDNVFYRWIFTFGDSPSALGKNLGLDDRLMFANQQYRLFADSLSIAENPSLWAAEMVPESNGINAYKFYFIAGPRGRERLETFIVRLEA